MGVLKKILAAGEGKKIKLLEGVVPLVNSLEDEMQALDDEGLRSKTQELRDLIARRETDEKRTEALDEVLREAFAVVREASRRVLGQRHFD